MAGGNYLGDDYYGDGPMSYGELQNYGNITNGPLQPWQIANGGGAAQQGSLLPAPGQFVGAGQLVPAAQYGVPVSPEQAYGAPPSGLQQAAGPEQGPPQSGGGGGTGGGGGGAQNGGLFNLDLYSPFSGVAPNYNPPTLPNAPNFDDFYNQSQYSNPVYHQPTMRQAPAFVPNQFHTPTLEEAQNQPGYQFGVQQGEKALQQSRASQGLLRTGGTLKDILDYGRNAATQNYGNVFNQDLSQFQTNEGGRVNAYNTNYNTQYRDPNNYDILNAQNSFQDQLAGNNQALNVAQARFQPRMTEYQTNAANAQRQAELGYNADWQRYLDKENVFYNNQNGPFSKYLSLAQLGAQNA